MKKSFFLVLCCIALYNVIQAQYSVSSPDSTIEIKVDVGHKIKYSIYFQGKSVLTNSEIGYVFRHAPPFSNDIEVLKTTVREIEETWFPVLKRYESILNHCLELCLEMKELRFPRRRVNLTFRVFNDGVAFRTEFIGPDNDHVYVMTNELTNFNFTANYECWAANHGGYQTHQENEYFRRKFSDLNENMVIGLPITVKLADDCYAAITEANITDYAGMYLKVGHSQNEYSLHSQLSPLPGQGENGDKVIFRFPHKTPWRVIILGSTPGQLVESEIVMNLNDPCAIKDPSWIKPGISAWDHWWSGEVKMDNETIKQYIDLAAEMNWPYQLIDWQWYGQFDRPEADITKADPQLDMPGILSYAESKDVKCWLWLYWSDIDDVVWREACALYKSWGIAGVKIDFMMRDDQEMVNWYHQIVKTAAEYHLMVDFHGAYKPDGWRRTYPNLVTREGVLGNEHNKWSLRITPEHITTLPFTRMLAGPMDYTPGGFLNRNPEDFANSTVYSTYKKNKISEREDKEPLTQVSQVMGTRAMQLALFVIYDSPFMVACDHPLNYTGQHGIAFLKKVKSIWDDTKVLNGQIGEFITMARRSKKEWFIGSITNSEMRTYNIKLDFLGEGKYHMVYYEDAPNSSINAQSIIRNSRYVTKDDIVIISMAPGGGYVAYIVPVINN